MHPRRARRVAAPAALIALAAAGCATHASAASAPRAPAAAHLSPLQVVHVGPADRRLGPAGAIAVEFSAPPTGDVRPQLMPAVPGTWTVTGATETFRPDGYWPPYTTVRLTVPAGATGRATTPLAASVTAGFTTPAASMLRAQQILARLGYLPVAFRAAGALPTTAAGERASAYLPRPGSFAWRFPALLPTLGSQWAPGSSSTVTRGAFMSFQADHGLTTDGLLGPTTWAALVRADLAGARTNHPYTTVLADLTVPQTVTVYAAGQAVLTSPVNSGIAGARTTIGTFPIYRRVTADTMRGTMPDGVSYVDVGVPWDNYFTGGEALHGFPRATYGYPQSNGCLELPIATAARVYGMLHVGDLITVTGDPTAHH